MDFPEGLKPPGRWWDSGAAEDAAATFLPAMRRLVAEAYRRTGSPYGEATEKALEQWLEHMMGTEEGAALERSIGEAWAFHLQVCFAARQVN